MRRRPSAHSCMSVVCVGCVSQQCWVCIITHHFTHPLFTHYTTDTPGVHLHHRLAHMLTPEELKSLHPRRTLRAYVPPTPLDICQAEEEATEMADQAVQDALETEGCGDDHDAAALEQDASGEPRIAPDASIKVSSVAWDADDEQLLAMFAPLASEPSLDVRSAAAALGRAVDSKNSTPRGKRDGQLSTPRYCTLECHVLVPIAFVSFDRIVPNRSAPSPIQRQRPVAATYLWGGIARVDVLKAPPQTALAFYGPPCLHVEPLPLLEEDDLVELDHHAEDDGTDMVWHCGARACAHACAHVCSMWGI